MKKFSNKALLLVTALLTSSYVSALVDVYKFGNTSLSGDVTYSTKAFEPYGGTLLVGTDGKNDGDATYALASVTRSDTVSRVGTTYNSFLTANATHPVLTNNKRMQNVGIVQTGGFDTAATHFVCVTETYSDRLTSLLSSNNTTTAIPALDVSALIDVGGDATAGITHMTTCSSNVFLRITDDGATTNNGIAVININTANEDGTVGIGLRGGTAATLLNETSAAVDGGTTNAQSFNVLDMTCCSSLDVVYISGNGLSETGATDRILGVVKGRLVGNNTFLITRVTGVAPAATGSVIGTLGTGAVGRNVYINRVRCMETCSGLMYMIVNGADEETDAAPSLKRNKVYALRIAKVGAGTATRGDIIQNDTLAETDLTAGFNIDNLVSAAVGGGDLPWDAIVTTSDMQIIGDAVYVSGAPGVRNATNDPGTWRSQAMFDHEGKIVAWTPWERVFPSQGNDNNLNGRPRDDTPIFAVDARSGHIWRGTSTSVTTSLRRTRWNRPIETSNDNSLHRQLTEQLGDGCYCALDLPEGVPGIGNSSSLNNSLALFGGFEKVAFARTKRSSDNTISTDYANNGFDFRLTSNGLFGVGPIRCLGFSYNREAPLSGNSGKVFFFAGTNIGLYAYSRTSGGDGFQAFPTTGPNTIFDLSNATFSGGTWKRVNDTVLTPTTAVSQILTGSGDHIYFTTIDITSIDRIDDKLYQMPLAETVAGLVPRVIAQSGMEGFPDNAVFSGCALITTTYNTQIPASDDDELNRPIIGVISTNDGIYTSTCDLRHLRGSVINKQSLRLTSAITDPEWETIVTTTGIAHHSVHRLKDIRLKIVEQTDSTHPHYRPFRNTHFWSIPILDDSRDLGLYENSTFLKAGLSGSTTVTSIHWSGNPNTLPVNHPIHPKPVDVTEAVANRRFALNKDNTNFSYVDGNQSPAINFYSDGGRRFFTRFNPDEAGVYSALRMLPFSAATWNMTSAESESDLSDVQRIFWIENISGTGQLMAGVDDGVIVLD